MLVAVSTTVVFGTLPGWVQGLRPGRVLKGRGSSAGSLGSALNTRRLLMIGEVALAFSLVLGAGLAIRSARNLHQVDPGFEAEHLLTLRVSVGQSSGDVSERARTYALMLEALSEDPSVAQASMASSGPLSVGPSAGMRVEGVEFSAGETPDVGWQFVDIGYFSTFGIELMSGRSFARTDRDDAVPVGVVNATLARQVFGTDDPIGRRVNTGIDGEGVWVEVVGVVADTRNRGPASAAFPTLFRPMAQAAGRSGLIGVRVSSKPNAALISRLTAAVHGVDPDAPVYRVQTGAEMLDLFTMSTRLVVSILGVFALLALTLATVGIYGVTAYAVRSRTRDLGVRIALGATGSRILSTVMTDTLRACLVGLGIGLVLAVAVGGALRGLLFGVSPFDPLTMVAVALLMVTVAAGASLGPAVRAARLDPVESLRAE